MSKEWTECLRKHRFNSHEAARKAKVRRQKNKKITKKPVRTYHCPHCGGWHLTSKQTFKG